MCWQCTHLLWPLGEPVCLSVLGRGQGQGVLQGVWDEAGEGQGPWWCDVGTWELPSRGV
jgi:hypothetical protein